MLKYVIITKSDKSATFVDILRYPNLIFRSVTPAIICIRGYGNDVVRYPERTT